MQTATRNRFVSTKFVSVLLLNRLQSKIVLVIILCEPNQFGRFFQTSSYEGECASIFSVYMFTQELNFNENYALLAVSLTLMQTTI